MVEPIADLYKMADIADYEDIHLLTLSEHCAVLEEQVYAIARNMPETQRYILEAYIHTRDDLETETFKTALRWGKRHIK